MPDTDHPTRKDLFEFLVGTLPEEAAETVSVHLDTCTVCQATLAELDESEDALVGKLRQQDGADLYVDEPQREMAVQRARAAAAESEKAVFSATTGSSDEAENTTDALTDTIPPILAKWVNTSFWRSWASAAWARSTRRYRPTWTAWSL